MQSVQTRTTKFSNAYKRGLSQHNDRKILKSVHTNIGVGVASSIARLL